MSDEDAMRVTLPGLDAFLAASHAVLDDLEAGRVTAHSSTYDLNGIGRLAVEYSTPGAAQQAIRRALGDAADGHAATWRHRVDDRGGCLSVVYAVGVAADDPDGTPTTVPGRGRRH